MRVVVQRVARARVTVEDRTVGTIGRGLLVFVGVAAGDGAADSEYIASKVCELRIFPDEAGRMNRSVVEAGGALLAVSQVTLLGDVRKGRRPAFDAAEAPAEARRIYEDVLRALRSRGIHIETGEFGAHMTIEAVNDGPVTILIDSRKAF